MSGLNNPSPVPESIGPYKIVRELGRGGMGIVYEGLDTALNRKVALKVMLVGVGNSEAAKSRFLREAQAAAQVTHENAVIIFGADVENGIPYIAMQYLNGVSLEDALQKNPNLSVSEIVRIGIEAASGLNAAHQLGIIHRDIKPANLWLESPNQRVKVLDFGLAKYVDSEVQITQSGTIVGTPAYMSPEQVGGEKLDHRSDLFSLGAVLYRLCTGQTPFPGPTTMAILSALASKEPIPIRQVNPNIPEGLASLIAEMLAKNPEDRPQNASEIIARLQTISAQVLNGATTAIPTRAINPQSAPSTTEIEKPYPSKTTQIIPTQPKSKPIWWNLWIGIAVLVAFVVVGLCGLGMLVPALQKMVTTPKNDPTVKADPVVDTPIPVVKEKDPPKVEPKPDDREPALAVLKAGGKVKVNHNPDEINQAQNLPKDPFVLTEVNLQYTKNATLGLVTQLRECKQIKVLNMGSTETNDEWLKVIATYPNLEVLNLEFTKISIPGLNTLKGKKLKTLWIPIDHRNDEGLPLYLRAIDPPQKLDLDMWKITNVGLREVARQMPEIRTLSLSTTQISDAGIKDLLALKNLQHIELMNTRISDEGAKILTQFESLEYLSFWGTSITNNAVKTVKSMKSLHTLDLRNTVVTDDCLEDLKEMTTLKKVVLLNTKVTRPKVDALRKLIPNCSIIY